MFDKNLTPAIVSFAEVSEQLFVTPLFRYSDQFHIAQEAEFSPSPELKEFWSRREAMLAQEVAESSSPAVVQALAKKLLREGRDAEADSLLESADQRGVRSAALEAVRVQVACRLRNQDVASLLNEARQRGLLDTADPELRIDLASGLLVQGEVAEARRVLDTIDLSALAMPTLASVVAEIRWRTRDEGPAWAAAERALRLDDHQVRAINVMGCIRVHQRRYEDAEGLFVRALEMAPLFRPSLLNQIVLRACYTGEDVDWDAIGEYTDAYPTDFGFALRVASLAFSERKLGRLEGMWRRLNQDHPQAEPTIRIGIAFARTQKTAEGKATPAATALLRSLGSRLTPDLPDAAFEYALADVDLGSAGFAESVVGGLWPREAIPEWLWAALNGLLAILKGDLGSALSHLLTAHQSRRLNVLLTRQLMACANVLNHHAEAAKAGETLLDSDFSTLGDWNNTIYSLLMAGDLAEANARWTEVSLRPAWDKALGSLYPTRATLGLLRMLNGDFAAGEAEYVAAERIADNKTAKTRVRQKLNLEAGRYLLREGQLEEARRRLTEALTGPDEFYAQDAQGLLE